MADHAEERSVRLVIVGDLLLDRDLEGSASRLCPDAPVPVVDEPVARARPGGAGLAALLAASDGVAVTLVTPVAADAAGEEAVALLERAGVDVVPLPLDGATPEKVRVRAGGQSVVRLDYGGATGTVGQLTEAAAARIREADAVLVSDYGRGTTAEPSIRSALADAVRRVPVIWDPHPRGAEPVAGLRLVTPNRAEAALLSDRPIGAPLREATQAAFVLRERWAATGVAITLGSRGAVLVAADGTPLVAPAPEVGATDPCGAGDRFAARAASALASGALVSEAVVDAVACAAAFVAAGGAAALDAAALDAAERSLDLTDHSWAPVGDGAADAAADGAAPVTEAALALVRRQRAAGATVVATGGCFDLLHAGHVRMLQAARALGDCLVVCLNDDQSVRRLKGPDRPLVPAADRAAVLLGLDCVDGVAVFSEDTPETVLSRLRPDVWAKGADYAVADLPEAPLVASWGGQAVVVPYLDGRSTTRLIQEATRRARI